LFPGIKGSWALNGGWGIFHSLPQDPGGPGQWVLAHKVTPGHLAWGDPKIQGDMLGGEALKWNLWGNPVRF